MPQATFYVISDAAAVKHILKEKTFSFDKGLLAEILEPILGKGLIPVILVSLPCTYPMVLHGLHAAPPVAVLVSPALLQRDDKHTGVG